MENSALIPLATRAGQELSLLKLEPGSPAIQQYVETGRAGYRDHYCHLWPDGDPWPYVDRNFTQAILAEELEQAELHHWLVSCNNEPGGICKVDCSKGYPGFLNGHALYLEKLYFRNEFTGQGAGAKILDFLKEFASRNDKKGVWLEAMKKGPALGFYLKNGFEIIGETQVPYPEVVPEERHMWVLGLAL